MPVDCLESNQLSCTVSESELCAGVLTHWSSKVHFCYYFCLKDEFRTQNAFGIQSSYLVSDVIGCGK